MLSLQPITSNYAVDPDYRDRIRKFVDDLPRRVDDLNSYFYTRNLPQLHRCVRQLASICTGFGFHELAPTANLLIDVLGKSKDMAEIEPWLKNLISECNRIEFEPF